MTKRLPIALVLAPLALAVSACDGGVANPVAPNPSLTSSSEGTAAPGDESALRNGNRRGNTPAQLTHAGWACLNVPGHGVHCLDPHWSQLGIHIQVKVFDTDDPTSASATFLGTESLIWNSVYKGQPCQPGHSEYFLLPDGPLAGYYACHHFDL